MTGRIREIVKKLFQPRDELSFGNVRPGYLPVLLVFPLLVITGNIRYYSHSVALTGIETGFLPFFLFGLGWLITAFLPKKLFIPALRLAVIFSSSIIIYMPFMSLGFGHFIFYMAFQFFNGLGTACAFYLFCFHLNNIERLLGMAIIQIFYGFYYTAGTAVLVIYTIIITGGSLFFSALLIAMVFLIKPEEKIINTESDGKKSGVHFVIGLSIIHYMIMCMGNYIEWNENAVSALAFGFGIFVSIILIIILQLLNSRNSMYIWFLFLAFTLLGLGSLLNDSPLPFIFGSFSYGLGDSLGYIIICYMCAGAIKKSKSLRLFRLYCLVLFMEYFLISGLFTVFFNYFDAPNRVVSFGVVLVLVSVCIFLMPLIQKRIFEADWTDGLYLKDMDEYSAPLAETENINEKEKLDLTPREKEIFAMLLNGIAPKEIAHTLKISYHTEHYHQKNLYRKLGIQSIAELFARYSGYSGN